jgi:hypothetical protein
LVMTQGYVWREPWAIPQLLYESCPIRMCYTSFWPEFQGDSESAAINIKFCLWHPLWLVCITHGNYNNCVMQYLLELQGSLFWVNCGFGWLLFSNIVWERSSFQHTIRVLRTLLEHSGRTNTGTAVGSFVSYYYILRAPYSVFRTLCYVEIGVLCPK